MNISINAVGRIIGLAFLVIGLSMLPSLIVAGIYNEKSAILAFTLSILICTIIGGCLVMFWQETEDVLRVRDGFLVVTICWFIAGLAGALPFMISGSIPSFPDAFFESCSGFSTTGASILTDIESLPKSILFWRSFTHWIGGMGILIFAIALMPSLGINGQNVAVSEAPGPTLDKVTPKMSDTAKTLYTIYLIFTVVETILLMFGGMSLYDALVHSFGTVGTGGFSNYGASIAHFNSVYIEIVIIVFMILSGVNFNLYYLSMKRGLPQLLKDSEFRFYILIIGTMSLLIMLNLYFSGTISGAGQSARSAVFQVASIVTTTGYATADYNLWPTFSQMLLLMLMFVGGCASSTGGGIKVIRVLLILKLIRRGIATRLHPNAIVNVKLNNRNVPAETVIATANHMFLYIIIVFMSTILIAFDGHDMITSFTSVITCVGNIGPGFELVGPANNFAFFSGGAKVLLAMLMLAGRLELYTLLIIFTRKFWNADKY